MQVYSNGKSRVIKGAFPKRFKLSNAGVDVPFLRTSSDAIRLSGEIPVGVLDVVEVQKKPIKKEKRDYATFSIINKSEIENIREIGKLVSETQSEINKNLSLLSEHEKTISSLETNNAQAIDQTNTTMVEMAKAFGKEIQADRDSLLKTAESITSSLKQTGDILSLKIEAHEKAKNPHKITKAVIGLANVDDTSDFDKPISKATQKALDKKVDKSDLEEVNKKLTNAVKRQDLFVKSIENSNLYGGVCGADIIRGGKKGDFLSKASNKDGDYVWKKVSVEGYATIQQLNEEINNRELADNGLQRQIDAITVSSDVTDVVGTYAQLQAYDTSGLLSNSIIKVLQDESRDDETTYYRWVITEGVGSWVLIGEEGPYYTKSEMQTMLLDYEKTINKVTSLSAQSTDTQYPSAKCMWDLIGDVESLINAL